ncbi:MAG: hypothetical protein CFE38_08255 [Comamonadaceae bacterium PBBC1]|nr:MAG: hypothetical protein CFE38_08255 [Comamonadaceae bacterium PBBC1]
MSNTNRLGYVDSWRFWAVLIVIIGHLFQVKNSFSPINAAIGVYIFFFISGFVVSKSSLIELSESGSLSVVGFYTRRVFRIIPPLLIYLSFCFILGQFEIIEFSFQNFISASMYLCNLNLVDCGWYGGHTWSLAFEEQFYLLFPLIFIWVHTSHRPRIWILISALAVVFSPFFYDINWVGKSGFILIYGLFLTGCVFAKYEQSCMNMANPTLIFSLGFVMTFLLGQIFNNNVRYYKIIYIISIPIMIIASSSPHFLFKNFFESQILKYIGGISYSIYLWQQFFTGFMKNYSITINIACILFMFLWCMLLFKFIENPLIKKGKLISKSLKYGKII